MLYKEIIGHGSRAICFLHGWAMNSTLFKPVAHELGNDFCSHLIDLPGHGKSTFDDNLNSEAVRPVLQEIANNNNGKINLCAWSMSALFAIELAARHSDLINKLVLVTSTPCFVQRDDWAFGIEKSVLERFADGLQKNVNKTLHRFLALQVKGIPDAMECARRARTLLEEKPEPDKLALAAGLKVLAEYDVRNQCQSINCPTMIINGTHDTLMRTSAARWLAENIPHGRSCIIKGAGHAPFISHPDKFNRLVNNFLHD